MAKMPDYQPILLPEGHYKFKVTDEPEIRKTGTAKWMIFKFLATAPDGNERKFSDVFFPSDEKYRRLLLIAGAKPDEKGVPHLSNMDTTELIGVEFEADIVHAPDKKDPSKTRDSIVDIVLPDEDVPPPSGKDDEVPF